MGPAGEEAADGSVAVWMHVVCEGGGELFQHCAAQSGRVCANMHAPRYLSYCVKLVWRPFSPHSGFYLQS